MRMRRNRKRKRRRRRGETLYKNVMCNFFRFNY
jgi:hypothetical protein